MNRFTINLLAIMLLFSAMAAFPTQEESKSRVENYYSLILTSAPNTPPVIDPLIKQKIKWSKGSAILDATVTDNSGAPLVFKWTQLEGPDDVGFSPDDTEDTTVTFPAYGGSYLLQLSVSDGEFTVTAEVPVTYDFLRNYTNPEQHKLPADRVYPMGQKMMLTAWVANSASKLQDIANAGFTMWGPVWDTRTDITDPLFQKAEELGLRAAHKVNDGYGLVYKLCPELDDGDKEEQVWRTVTKNLNRALNNSVYDDQIDIWLQGTEEISTRFHQCDQDKLLDYIQDFKDKVVELDPEKRPLWMSDVTGVNSSQMNVTHKWLDMVGPQMYVEHPVYDNKLAVVRSYSASVIATADNMDRNYPVVRPRPKTASLGLLYEPSSDRDNLDYIRADTMHDVFLALNTGLNGLQFYSWYNYTGGDFNDTQTWEWYKTGYKEAVKLLTDNKFDYAYLWGDRRDDLTLWILSGPGRIQWIDVDGQHDDYPTISMQNIQYGDERFVILINSGTDTLQVEIEEFPVNCVKVLDIREETYIENTGRLRTNLQPLDVRLYRLESETDCTP